MEKSNSPPPGSAGGVIPKTPTRIRGLDDILHGGIPTGRISIFSGRPGTGKTVLALEILYRAALAGEPGVFITFEERADNLRANFSAMGMDLSAMEDDGGLKIVEPEIPHRISAAGDFDVHGLLAMLEGHARPMGAGLIALDAVDVLMQLFSDQSREREEFHLLFDWLRKRRMTGLLTAKATGERLAFYPFLDFMADCVLYLDQRMEAQIRTRRIIVVKYRGSGFMNNEYPFVLGNEGFVAMPVSSITLDQRSTSAFVGSGNPRLDAVLGGGYPRGSSVLIHGPSGAGKTTLASTFVQHICGQGEKALYINLERSDEMLMMGMASVGLDLSSFVASGMLHLVTALPESAGIEQHLLRVLDAVDRFSPDHMVVDSISTFRRMGSEQAAFDFLIRLLMISRTKGITGVYTNQSFEAEGGMRIANANIASLMDTLVGIAYVDDGERIRRNLQVLKSRGVAHSLRYHEMEISDGGITLAATADDCGGTGASGGTTP